MKEEGNEEDGQEEMKEEEDKDGQEEMKEEENEEEEVSRWESPARPGGAAGVDGTGGRGSSKGRG